LKTVCLIARAIISGLPFPALRPMSALNRPLSRLRLKTANITCVLILANIAVYAVTGLLDTRAFESLSRNSFLIDWGANVPLLTLNGDRGRLFTSLFLHVGLAHLALNMLALWSLGRVLEPRMRGPAFLGVYLLSGLCGSLATAWWNLDVLLISCGASGAILGLFGVALVCSWQDRRTGRPYIPMRALILSLVLTFGAGALFSVDNAAHLGGLLTGLTLGGLMIVGERLQTRASALLLPLAGLLVLALLAGLVQMNLNAGLRKEIAAARLLVQLHHIGFTGDTSWAVTGSLGFVQCTDRALQPLSDAASYHLPDPDLQALLAGLHQCGSRLEQREPALHRHMPGYLAQCRAQVHTLAAWATPDEHTALAALDGYCEAQTRLYAIAFDHAPADLGGLKALQARSNAPYDVLKHVPLFDGIGDLPWSLAQESGCPYWSCARFE
jgi:membrane associated rhomboid family serine protease